MSSKDDSLMGALTKMIPGYGAYVDQESRRADDRLTREFLVKRVGDCKSQLDKVGSKAVAAGDLDSPVMIESLRSELDRVQARLAAAVEGYAGWFSERSVDAKLLEQVGRLDANLVSLVDQIETLAREQNDATRFEPRAMQEAIDMLHQRVDRRNEMIRTGN